MNSNKEQELRDKVELVVGYYLSGQFNADTPEGVGYIALEDACTNSVIALIEEEIRKARIDELHLFEQCSDDLCQAWTQKDI